jgi:drug/metabolite transporter (DMT)-like permease
LWPVIAGAALALHFGFWIASVKQTSVVTSVVLVTTTPLFIGLASPLVLKENVALTTWAGIGVSAAGAAVMAADDVGEGLGTLSGDAYALLGAVFAAVYFIAGRRSRQRTPLAGYVGVVYPIAGVLLIGSALLAGEPFTGYSAGTYTAIVLLAVLPQLIGHSAIDWALGYVPATLVAISILGEPVVATGLAAVLLDEQPNFLEGLGSVFVLAGVYIALRPAASSTETVTSASTHVPG